MKKIFCLVATLLVGAGGVFAANPYKGIAPDIAKAAQANIALAGANGPELLKAIEKAPRQQKEGMAFVVAYMPAGDRDTLTADFLLEEVGWGYKAREAFAWTKALPDSIFYNEVLPYASMDEKREPWRAMFWEKLYPIVGGMTDEKAVIDTINARLQSLIQVEYNTKRKKPNQSPSESMSIHMASCSGLSILLTDALRTMGIPSRIAGTPMWVTREGNHNWSEIWYQGKWYFVEYNPTPAWSHSWFLERAGKADKSNPIYGIYATSWKTTGTDFPMVWDRRKTKKVPGVDVTDAYIAEYNAQKAEAKEGTPVSIKLYLAQDGGRSSADRVQMDIRVVDMDNKMVAAGKTAGKTDDMNNYLMLYIPSGKNYKVLYGGKSTEFDTNAPRELILFAQ